MSDALKFFTKNGHKIPIRQAAMIGARGHRVMHKAARATGAAYGASLIARHGLKEKDPEVKISKSLAMASLGTSVASGALAAATFTGGVKKIAAGGLGVHLIDALGIGLNTASVKGGTTRQKANVIAKQEAVNFAVGNAVWLAGIAVSKTNRKAVGEYSGAIVNFARKALRVI